MEDSRTKNSFRNILWGTVNKIIMMIFPFIVRSIIIYRLGIQYVGLNSLFSSVLSFLSIAELGMGSAIVYSMYGPAARNDIEKLGALYCYYKKCYKAIGMVVFGIGLCMMPFIPKLINGGYPGDINLYALYIIFLSNSVVSYFLYSYKSSLLQAYQRKDIISNINTAVVLAQYVIQITVLLMTRSYYAYIIILPFGTIIINLVTSEYVDKKYPQILCKGILGQDEKRQLNLCVKGMLYAKIGGSVLYSIDNIVISAYLGLSDLALYNNYYLIFTSINGILAIITGAIIPSVGNAINTKTSEENQKDFIKFNFIYIWIVTWFAACFIGMCQTFMKIWVGEELLLPNRILMLFVMKFIINHLCDMNFVYQEAAGLWYENRYIQILSAALNLILNLVFVRFWGLSGILLATIISLAFVTAPGYVYVLFKYYFKKGLGRYALGQGIYLLAAIGICTVTFLLTEQIKSISYTGLILKGIICATVPNILLFLVYFKNPVYKEALGYAKMLKGLKK